MPGVLIAEGNHAGIGSVQGIDSLTVSQFEGVPGTQRDRRTAPWSGPVRRGY